MPSTLPSPVSYVGLSATEAQIRLKADGFNELPRSNRRTPLRIILEIVREPMLALLLAGGLIYLAFGDLQDALVLLAFATFSVLITVVQESRTERVLEALRDLTSPRALVIRDGERKRIPGREVVMGDLVVLSEGDRVPADAVLVQCQDFQTDESMLTGESIPVRKVVTASGPLPETTRPGGDDLPHVYSGSLVVRGSGVAEVFAIGPLSEIGKIGHSLITVETEPPRLRAQTQRLVLIFAVLGGSVSVLAVLLFGFLRGGWLDALLTGIALGMSMLPAEFPIVLAVFMAMGAWRISKARVLTRRAAAIESLGSATVLCTDKTGTLTENRMSVAELRLANGEVFRPDSAKKADLPENFQTLVEHGILASDPKPFDPMDKAFHVLGSGRLVDTWRRRFANDNPLRVYGLSPELLAVTQVWQTAGDDTIRIVAVKGAPEAIASLCHMDGPALAALMKAANDMAAAGLRVLGVAQATAESDTLPESQRGFAFRFLGLAGLADPLRAGVPNAVRECRSAGIRVVMITGDYPATARAIALEAGLAVDDIITGTEITALDDAELAVRVRTATVFARVMPEQKLRIVNAMKADGEVTAMTGDGVNDAPALKTADIGIAMGGRGTDVAREAASIVLLDDDFGSIVKAVRLGRRIYDNLRKAMGFILAVHVPIAGLSLVPLILGLPILFGPIHIAFLQMIVDPVCALVFEAEKEEDDVMNRPPRPTDERLFSRALVLWGVVQGVGALLLCLVVYLYGHARAMPESEIRALTFFALVMSIVSLIFVNRSFSASLITALRRPNKALLWVLVTVAGSLTAILAWPFAAALFRFGPLHFDDLLLTLGAGVLLLAALELLKPVWRDQLPS